MHPTRPLCTATSHPLVRPAIGGHVYADVAAADQADVVLGARDDTDGSALMFLTADEATALAEQLLCSVRAAAMRDALAAALAAVAPPF